MFEMRPYRRNSMSTWNPFSEMEEMERRLFNNDFFSGRGLAEFKTDITDEGDYYELKADLPGFKKEDITPNMKSRRKRGSTCAVSVPTARTAGASTSPASGRRVLPPPTTAVC